MYSEKSELTLWEECKNVFQSINNRRLDDFLLNIIEIVKKNYNIFTESADHEFLSFIMSININDYIIGTNGDDYEIRVNSYLQKDNVSVDEIWRMLSQLIWDLTVPVTNKICPSCRCDNLVILIDKDMKHTYQSCENCFYISEGGKQISRPSSLFPARKNILGTIM